MHPAFFPPVHHRNRRKDTFLGMVHLIIFSSHAAYDKSGSHFENLKACAVCGADVSVIAEGQVNYHSTKRLPYGGVDLDKLMASLLEQRGIHCSDPQRLKETCASATSLPSSSAEVAGHFFSSLLQQQTLSCRPATATPC